MSWIVLNQPRIRALVGHGEATSVPELVGVRRKLQARQVAIFAYSKPCSASVKGLAALAHKKSPAGRLHRGAVCEPCLDNAQFVGA